MNRKPYPKYKESDVEWLGQVPEHWEVKKLSWLFSYSKGKNAASLTKESIADSPGDFPVFSGQTENDGLMGSIDSFEFDFKLPVVFVTTVGARAMSTRLVNGQFSLSQNCALIIPRKNEAKPGYYLGVLQSLFDYERRSISLIMQPSLRFEDLNRFWVPAPPENEQTAIADFLDRETGLIDTLVAKKRRLIALLGEKRTALISRTVTRGLPAEAAREFGLEPHTRFKDSGIEWLGEVPAGWDVKKVWIERVSQNIELQDGNHGELHPKAEDYVSEGIPFIMANHIDNGKIDFNKCNYIEREQADSLRIGFSMEGDVLLTHKGTVGRVGIVQEINFPYVMLTPQVTYYRCLRKIRNRFLFWLMQSTFWQDQLKLLAGLGSTRAYIGLLDQKTLYFIIPSDIEQSATSDYLDRETDKIDRLVTKVEAAIARLQEYRTALITAAVTGKIDVREVV